MQTLRERISEYSLTKRRGRAIFIIIVVIIIITHLLTAIKSSLDGSSPYTSTDKINENKYT